MTYLSYYINYLSNIYLGYPVIIRIAIFFVNVLVVGYVFAVVKIYTAVGKEKKVAQRKQSIANRFEQKMQKILLVSRNLNYEEIDAILEVSEYKLKNWEKIEITNLVLKMKSSSKEFNEQNFKCLIETLNLAKFWQEELTEKSFEKNRDAVDVLRNFDTSISGGTFQRKINSSDDDLRKLMKTGYLRFASNDVFFFLEGDFDQSFNNLDAIRIHNALKEREKIKPLPMLMRWVLMSKNENYQCFLINEVAFFEQIESVPFLLELYMKTSSDKVKIAIAKTLGELKSKEAISMFSHDYYLAASRVQFAIVASLGNIGSSEAYTSLHNIYQRTHDDEMLLRVIESMYKIDAEETQRLINSHENASAIEQKMLGSLQHKLLHTTGNIL